MTRRRDIGRWAGQSLLTPRHRRPWPVLLPDRNPTQGHMSFIRPSPPTVLGSRAAWPWSAPPRPLQRPRVGCCQARPADFVRVSSSLTSVSLQLGTQALFQVVAVSQADTEPQRLARWHMAAPKHTRSPCPQWGCSHLPLRGHPLPSLLPTVSLARGPGPAVASPVLLPLNHGALHASPHQGSPWKWPVHGPCWAQCLRGGVPCDWFPDAVEQEPGATPRGGAAPQFGPCSKACVQGSASDIGLSCPERGTLGGVSRES